MTPPEPTRTGHDRTGQATAPAADRLVPSVLPAGQAHPRAQRQGRYFPASTSHPARMLPELARHLIGLLTEPGELVADGMCGTGTTLVEAVHLGRHAVGVDLEPRWVSLARANLVLANSQHAPGTGRVFHGDARTLADHLPAATHGQVSLLLTSPPYGKAAHGQVHARPGAGVTKTDWTYTDSTDPANLANTGLDGLLDGVQAMLAHSRTLLKPGGTVALTARPYRHAGELVDLPGALVDAAARAGLHRAGRLVAVLAGLRGTGLVPRATFFALHNTRTARAAGHPVHLLAHEDVLLFRTPA